MPVTINGTTGITNVNGTAAAPAETGTTSTNTGVFFPAANTLGFSTAGAEVGRFDSSGRLGVGETSPTTTLDIKAAQGRIKLTSSTGTNNALLLFNNTGGNAYVGLDSSGGGLTSAYALNIFHEGAYPIVFSTSNTERARIDSSGRFVQAAGCLIQSVGTYNNTTSNAANLYMGSGGVIERSTSALKYKQDIRDLEAININVFRAVRYKSKCANDDQTKDHFGVIADEVDAAGIKELVTYGEDGEVEGFQYERLTVVLLKALQELNAKVDAQAAEIAALKGQA